MKAQLEEFLEHLRLNENASLHTVRAYESDLSQFLLFLAERVGRKRMELTADDFNHHYIRDFMADLSRRGNSRSSAARKLAAIRTFGRYLRREGVLEGDPAALVGTPKREHRLPAHLGEAEMARLLEMPDGSSMLGRRDAAGVAEGLGRPAGSDCADVEAGRRPSGTRAALPELPGHAAVDQERGSSRKAVRGGVQRPVRHQPTRAAAFICHAPSGARRRPAGNPGAAGALAPEHHTALYPRQRGAAARDV